jgi:hypothetical protein
MSDYRFIECMHQSNRRLINVLIDKVMSNSITESSALEIAKDSWITETGSLGCHDRLQIEVMWANSLCNQFS